LELLLGDFHKRVVTKLGKRDIRNVNEIYDQRKKDPCSSDSDYHDDGRTAEEQTMIKVVKDYFEK
jgi:hypothetical protein